MLGNGATAPAQCDLPVHVLFPQLLEVVSKYIEDKVVVMRPADKKDLFLSPYYGWLVERLLEAIQPDTSMGEVPEVPRYEANRPAGSTADVDLWTSRDVRDVIHSHLNYAVADTKRWEQSAAYYIDTHPAVFSFAKNSGLGFAIPYFNNGQTHDYIPDFLIRLKTEKPVTLIFEIKGFDPLEELKIAAANRWVSAVNADGTYGTWKYAIVRKPTDVRAALDTAMIG